MMLIELTLLGLSRSAFQASSLLDTQELVLLVAVHPFLA
jgi:hypothetical protein